MKGDEMMDSNPLAELLSIIFSTVGSITSLTVTVLLIVANWRIFEKAGEAGWKSIIPIYSSYILFKILSGNGWKFLLALIPVFNIVVAFAMYYRLAQVFGHGVGFTLGLLFFPNVFTLILAFGSSSYYGPVNSFI